MRKINIALDGPSGVGKSTVADHLAARHNMTHLDTGAMYRAVAYGMKEKGIQPADSGALRQALAEVELQMNGDRVLLNGQDVTDGIRTPEISTLASRFSALPVVRKKLVALQRTIAAGKGCIVDGRDICDVVLPDAEVKVFLTASTEARAARRFRQDREKGLDVSYEQVFADIEARDLADRMRRVSPLQASWDAVVVDSSEMDLEQTVEAVDRIVSHISRRSFRIKKVTPSPDTLCSSRQAGQGFLLRSFVSGTKPDIL